MFLVTWSEAAFEQMQQLLLDHPSRRTDFVYALRTLERELNQSADMWGESRGGNDRLGFPGPLSVLVEVDPDDRTVTVLRVTLFDRHPPA